MMQVLDKQIFWQLCNYKRRLLALGRHYESIMVRGAGGFIISSLANPPPWQSQVVSEAVIFLIHSAQWRIRAS